MTNVEDKTKGTQKTGSNDLRKKNSELEKRIDIDKLKKEITVLEKKIEHIRTTDIAETIKSIRKLRTKFYIASGIGLAIILFTLLPLLTNYTLKFNILQVEFQFSRDVLTNLFFLGLAIFSLSFILFQMYGGFFNDIRLQIALLSVESIALITKDIYEKKHLIDIESTIKNLKKLLEIDTSKMKPLTEKEFEKVIEKMKEAKMIREDLTDYDKVTYEEDMKIEWVVDKETYKKHVLRILKELMKKKGISELELEEYKSLYNYTKKSNDYKLYAQEFEEIISEPKIRKNKKSGP